MLYPKVFLSRKSFFFPLVIILLVTPNTKAEEIITINEKSNAEYQSNLGAYHWQKGDYDQAIDAWELEAEIYQSQGLKDRESEAILKIAGTRIGLGEIDTAIFQLKEIISSTQDSEILAKALNKLGDAYSQNSELSKASEVFKKSFDIKKDTSILNNLAELERKQGILALLQSKSSTRKQLNQQYLKQAESHQKEALRYAQEGLLLTQTDRSSASVKALIEWAKVSETELDDEQLTQGRKILANLPDSRPKVYLGINWAKIDSEQADYWLSQSVEVAKTTGDIVAESFALFEQGLLAEKSGDLSKALDYARLSQLQAQTKFAFDSLYRSQWLAARAYQKSGNKEAALSNYRNAIASLDVLNQSSRKIDVVRRFNFKEEIEPIYRQTLTLLLEQDDLTDSDLKEVLFFADKLRLEQLRNYFGDNCVEIRGEVSSVEDILAKKNAVAINSIILENQTYIIFQFPDGSLQHSKVDLGQLEIKEKVTQWYRILRRGHNIQYQDFSRELYDLIIRPFEAQLAKINPKTMVFIHDGILRNVPMAALYDGKKHLVEKWATASSLGFRFQVVPKSKVEVAAFGLSIERGGWSALGLVPIELEQITETIEGKKFLNSEFTEAIFIEQLSENEYPVVHIATHGSFNGVAENSFILAYDKTLNALELKDILTKSQENIDLLVFSVCETAVGSEFSALGLAGVALRSGVNSSLGSYWAVEDSVQPNLMKKFYSNVFEKKLDKAEALRQVQIQQIEEEAFPNIWGALTLIGDW